MTETQTINLTPEHRAIVTKLRYMARQYTNGSLARGGSGSRQHYLDEAADAIEELAQRAAVPVGEVKPVAKLWLWKNFVDGRPEYWAFDNAFPVYPDSDDPQTLGEPCGYAFFKPSRAGRSDVDDAEVLRRIKTAAPLTHPAPSEESRDAARYRQMLKDMIDIAITLSFEADAGRKPTATELQRCWQKATPDSPIGKIIATMAQQGGESA